MKTPRDPRATFSRRMFLRGAAGFTLPMPFLGSLLKPGAARAASGPPRRFIAFATEHGGIWPEYMHPADATLTDKMTYAGHEIRRGALAPTMANGITTLSPVVSGSSSKLNPTLVSKMNLLRWVSARTIKETFSPPREFTYPYMSEP